MDLIKFILRVASLWVVCLMVPGCVPYHKIAKTEFPQGTEQGDKREASYNFLRTAKVYDQFRTQALFDAIWLSDEVRTAYTDLYSERRGKDARGREAYLRRQLEENQHWISLYVLADIRNKVNVSLNDKNSLWTLCLELDGGERVEPISIKEIDVEPEYQALFGYRFSLFKTAYLVKFPMKNLEGKPYLKEGAPLTLIMSTPTKSTKMVWNKNDFKKQQELLKDEDMYWI